MITVLFEYFLPLALVVVSGAFLFLIGAYISWRDK